MASKQGLEINAEKTMPKIMPTLVFLHLNAGQIWNIKIDDKSFETVFTLTFSRTIAKNQNFTKRLGAN
jgi:hypothetical protein